PELRPRGEPRHPAAADAAGTRSDPARGMAHLSAPRAGDGAGEPAPSLGGLPGSRRHAAGGAPTALSRLPALASPGGRGARRRARPSGPLAADHQPAGWRAVTDWSTPRR